MDVFLTFDVEIWCGSWSNLDRRFPQAFERYIYGRSKHGEFALPKTLEILKRFGLRATFFVEPLFAYRFGLEPLEEIVSLIKTAGQDVQLHLHPEWSDEADPPLTDRARGKRPLLSQYSLDEQTLLVRKAKEMLVKAGAPPPSAFRAGSYGCNRDTFIALSRNHITFDSSLNPGRAWSGEGLSMHQRCQRLFRMEGVMEYPIAVYADRPGGLRQVQVGSTSFSEFVHLLGRARSQGRRAFVIVSHNFEMMSRKGSAPDPIVVRRFMRLCEFLARHREHFTTVMFSEAAHEEEAGEPSLLTSPPWKVAWRSLEQAWRHAYS